MALPPAALAGPDRRRRREGSERRSGSPVKIFGSRAPQPHFRSRRNLITSSPRSPQQNAQGSRRILPTEIAPVVPLYRGHWARLRFRRGTDAGWQRDSLAKPVDRQRPSSADEETELRLVGHPSSGGPSLPQSRAGRSFGTLPRRGVRSAVYPTARPSVRLAAWGSS